jgi:hypothetical protein
MASVKFVPFSEIIIHEIVEQENPAFFEDIIRTAIAQPNPSEPTMNWINGIAFLAFQMAPTEATVKENLEGRIHFASVIFTRLTPFRNSFPVTIATQQYTVRLRNNSNNSLQTDIVRFLTDYRSS